MRKKFFNGKRVLALALALSMVVSEAAFATPADVAADEVTTEEAAQSTDEIAVEEVATEEVAAEEAAEEVVAEEEVAAEEAAEEEVAEEEAAEEEVSAEGLAENEYADAQKPGKIANVGFKSYIETGVLNPRNLSWDADQVADKYQIRIADASGYEYAYYAEETGLSYMQSYGTSCTLPTAGLTAYQAEGTGYKAVKDANGNTVTLKAGSYTVQVRAVNSEKTQGTYVPVTYYGYYFDEDDNYLRIEWTENDAWPTVKLDWYSSYGGYWNSTMYANPIAYGDWSDAVTYVIPETAEKVTDIRLVQEQNGSVYIDYSATGDVEMEIKDSAGVEYFSDVDNEWDSEKQEYIPKFEYVDNVSLYADAYVYEKNESGWYEIKKDAAGNEVKAFVAGKTYTIRLRGYSGYGKTKVTSEWSEPLTVTIPETSAPEKTGMLKFEERYNEVTWNKVDNAIGYEVELKDDAGNVYGDIIQWDSEKQKYTVKEAFGVGDSTSVNISGYYLPVLNADATSWEYKKNEDGTYVSSGVKGKTYTVRVRAYNYKKDSDEKQYSDWSEACSCAVPVQTVDPVTKVTGLHAANYGTPIVAWDALEKTEGLDEGSICYEVEIKDAAGRAYTTSTEENGVLKNVTTSDTKTPYFGVATYVKVDGVYEPVIDSKGSEVRAFQEGQTYTVKVRALAKAYNEATKRYDQDKTGDWSDPYTFTVPSGRIANGINAKPATVTGLWVKTEPSEDGTLYGPVLYWNEIENVDRYEIEVKDAAGNSFVKGYNLVNGKLAENYYSVNYNYAGISWLSGLNAYNKVDGSAVTTLRDAKGNPVYPFMNGQKYTIRVRAINTYQDKKADGTWNPEVQYVGDWSAPVTYDTVLSDLAVKGLKLVKSDKDYYYFDYTADTKSGSTVYYQIAKDTNFNAASLVRDWREVDTEYVKGANYKFVISKTSTDLDPSTTYYVRMINTRREIPGPGTNVTIYNEIMSTAAVASFTTDAKQVKTPKNITGLKLYEEDEDSYTFRFNAVLKEEDEDQFELQIANDPNSANWYTIKDSYNCYYDEDEEVYVEYTDRSCNISKYNVSEGTNYVRAVAYVWVINEKTGEREKVYGTPSNVVTVTKNTINTSSIGKISLAEETDYGYTFKFTGNVKKNESVEVVYSTSKNFATNNVETVEYNEEWANDDVNKKWFLSKYSLTPGKTYYVKMRVYNPNAVTTETTYSEYSNVVSVKAAMPKVGVNSGKVTKNSIQFTMSTIYSSDSWLSGYEVQKKVVKGKKTTWETVQTSSASEFVDKKLKADTVYSYRVRPYYFDKDTKKTTNGSWVYYEAMTGWSGALNAEAKAASKTSIKLSWNKVAGAKGYEIYRTVSNSEYSEISKGKGNGYSSAKLIANLGASKKSYTDKKLTAGMDYHYIIKAYKTVGGKKVYIEEHASASLDFELTNVRSYQKSNGTVVVTWNPVYSAKGYLIEKENPVTGKWSTYKTIKKAKTSTITLPKTKDAENGDTYRIRAYSGKKYTNASTISVDPVLAAPTKVTAKATKKGIKVTWKAVKGADYYKVYRTTNPSVVYNKDTKTYSYRYGSERTAYVADAASVTGYREKLPEEWKATTFTDEKLTYTKNGIANQTFYAGPDTGVKYYYYVVACKNRPQNGYVEENGEASYYQSGESKAASATFKETKPAKTSITKATSKSKKVTLKYKAAKNADGYEVERSTSKKKGFAVIKDVNKATTVTYTDKYSKSNPIKKGKTYYYRVRSYRFNDDGSKVYGSYSAVKAVKVK